MVKPRHSLKWCSEQLMELLISGKTYYEEISSSTCWGTQRAVLWIWRMPRHKFLPGWTFSIVKFGIGSILLWNFSCFGLGPLISNENDEHRNITRCFLCSSRVQSRPIPYLQIDFPARTAWTLIQWFVLDRFFRFESHWTCMGWKGASNTFQVHSARRSREGRDQSCLFEEERKKIPPLMY